MYNLVPHGASSPSWSVQNLVEAEPRSELDSAKLFQAVAQLVSGKLRRLKAVMWSHVIVSLSFAC